MNCRIDLNVNSLSLRWDEIMNGIGNSPALPVPLSPRMRTEVSKSGATDPMESNIFCMLGVAYAMPFEKRWLFCNLSKFLSLSFREEFIIGTVFILISLGVLVDLNFSCVTFGPNDRGRCPVRCK